MCDRTSRPGLAPSLHLSAVMHPPWPLLWTPPLALVVMAVFLHFRRQHAVPLSSAEHLSTVALAHILVLLSLHQSVARLSTSLPPMMPLLCAGALAGVEVIVVAAHHEPSSGSVAGVGQRRRWRSRRSVAFLWFTRIALIGCSLYVVDCAVMGDDLLEGNRILIITLGGLLTVVPWRSSARLPPSLSTLKPLLGAFLWGVGISALALRGSASTVCVVGLALGCAALLWRAATPRGEPAAEGSMVALTAALWFLTAVERGA